ncbi:hypothetical protein [Algibacter sp. PT7-4]|uniref:hypothetical protein n=1 Tax=Algibacter ulvanivorans TaxID=3400999 RepID=UPI003AAB46C6
MANEQELRIKALAEAIAADVKTLYANAGSLTGLNTSDKTSLVNAINEALAAAGGVTNLAIGTNNTTTLQITSSSGDNVTLTGATALLAGLMLAADKDKLDNIENGATANSADATLLARANHTGTQPASTISDFTAEVNNLIDAVVNGAPGGLNTLDELAAALGDDENFASTITTALGNRVRYDAAQTLTVGQRAQACANIGVGNPDRNFVTDYTTVRDA